jgi:cell wall-associated NlpC family hydrolase
MFLLGQMTKANGVKMAALAPNWQPGVDAFFKSMVGSYGTPTGALTVSTPFTMNPGYPDQQAFRKDDGKHAAMLKVASGAGLSAVALERVHAGRGTPEEIHGLTQGLINAQPAGMALLDPASSIWTPLDVRKLMHDHAIGIDCAGYVQQAYLRATGRTRDQLGFRAILNEDLSGLSQRGFVSIDALASVRAGDIIAFGVPAGESVGHRAIVFDQRMATADDLSTLRGATGGPTFAAGGPVRVLEMDSSYGSGGHYWSGGVERQTWLFNPTHTGGQWAYLHLVDGSTDLGTKDEPKKWTISVADSLYWHPFEGYFRRKGD